MRKFLKALVKYLFFPLVLLIICGCGFKLNSKSAIPPQLHTVYLQAERPYESFAIKFRKALKSYGINVSDTPQPGAITIHLAATSFTHTETSTGPSTQARVYNLVYSVIISLSGGNGRTILAPKSVSVTRDLTLAPNEIFEISTQVDTTKQSMEQELLIKIFNILSSKQVAEALR